MSLNPNQFDPVRFERLRSAIGQDRTLFDNGPTPAPPEPSATEKPGFYRRHYPGYPAGIGRESTHYEYQVPRADGGKERLHLGMEVHHQKPSAMYEYTQPVGDPKGHAADLAGGRWAYSPASKDAVQAYVEGEPKLFGSSYTPGRSEVFSLFGTKQGATHTGTMLGIAAKDTAERFGRTLTPPADLSPHSSRLVENLKGKGAVPETAPTTVTNEYEHYTEPEYTTFDEDARIPDDEVAAGRSTMRSVLRQGRPRKQRETYTQERLL